MDFTILAETSDGKPHGWVVRLVRWENGTYAALLSGCGPWGAEEATLEQARRSYHSACAAFCGIICTGAIVAEPGEHTVAGHRSTWAGRCERCGRYAYSPASIGKDCSDGFAS